jgi:hypothetical protein
VSLRPAAGGGTAPSRTDPVAEHKAVRVTLPGKTSDGGKSDLIFDLIYQGHGHTQ